MSKLRIKLGGRIHTCRVRVLYGDTDAGGVVYYGNYLRYFERGRTELMRENSISYKGLEDAGFIIPVVESYLRYKASARYDDLLQISTCLTRVRQVSCRFDYEIRRVEDGCLLVKGFTAHAVVDRAGKLSKLPGDVLAALTAIAAAV
ncbi:MAG: acyl-CoA thioesterase [Deltaproteobacteria bacterium]|nr:acyl-CoA thioesterase [Deltaproteobacteria bacterium]